MNIGRLLPLILGVFFAADTGSRFLPIDRLCFQAWECMTRYQEPGAIFEANRQFHSEKTHGNLSNMGNLPGERVYRTQVFTTDAHGFRNPGYTDGTPVSALVVGDSFAAGDALSDEETLTRRLSALTGQRFYNAAGPYAYLATVRTLKRTLGFERGPVLIIWTESEPIDQLRDAEALASHPDWKGRIAESVFGSGTHVRENLRGLWFASPMKIVWEKGFLTLSNDRMLPNIYSQLVLQRHLQNGDSMLFFPSNAAPFHQHRDVGPAKAYISKLAAGMRAEGMQPLVVLVPHKYSVYYPLVDGTKEPPGDATHPLSTLAASLRSEGIDTLDLTDTFRARARQDLASGDYIYWRDDTHWNGRGAALAAEAIRQEWFAGTRGGAMTIVAAPSVSRIADRHLRIETGLAILLCVFLVKSTTPALLWHAGVIAVMFLILTVPLGYIAAHLVLPVDAAIHLRAGLTLGLGYALAAPILIVTSRFGVVGLLAPALLALVAAGAHRLVSRPAAGPLRLPLFDPRRVWFSESTFVLLMIASLSLACVTPLMNPLRRVTSTTFVNYAYIDSYFHVNLVQRLMTSAPLKDWPNVAGLPPIFYQDYHHLLLATLARLGRVSATDMFFLYAPMILVGVTVLLAYVVGRALTGSRVGGYISAALQFIVLVPNVYDRNVFLQDRWTIVLPNFYQIHFYDLRYAQHASSGWILVLALVLCWIVALRAGDDRRTILRASLAACFLMAVVFRFRPQFALMMALPTGVLVLWQARRQPMVLIGAAVMSALSLAWVLYPYETLGSSSSGLVVKYGVFAARVSRAGYYLPNGLTTVIGFFPPPLMAFAGLALVVAMRIIGLNLLVLMSIGARIIWREQPRRLLDRPETYLWGAILGGFLAALLLEQAAVDSNIGWNILQGMVAPALLLATGAIVAGIGAARLESTWERHRKLSFALTAVFALIAFRGADALMHERPDRAYPLTTQALDAYAWVHEHAPATAVVASDPRHQVNAAGEMIQNTNFLSGMTERAVYFQYVSPLTRVEGPRRIALLTALYDTKSEVEACRLVREVGAQDRLEYSDRPFAVQPAGCLERVFQGDPSVYRAVDR